MSDVQQAGNVPAIPAAVNGSGAAAEPRGIGGWLLLVAFGQVVGPLRMLLVLGQYYLDPENLRVLELSPLAMYGELAMNACILALASVTAALFFLKSRHFPRFFILELVAVVVFVVLDFVWAAFAFSVQLETPIGELLVLEQQDVVQFGLAVANAFIWIPYTLKSRRVKNTFGSSNVPVHAANAQPDEQRTALLRAVVYLVGVMGSFGIVAGMGHFIGRGAFSGQLVGGALQIALAVWLFRGSNAARIVLAVLFAVGLVLFVGFAFVVASEDPTAFVIMSALAILSAACLWVLIFSKRFRAELALHAERYRKPDAEAEQV